MKFCVAPRTAAVHRGACDCCDRWRRCAQVPVFKDGFVLHTLKVCSGCALAAWNAAKKDVRR